MNEHKSTEVDIAELLEHPQRSGLRTSLFGWSMLLMLFEGYDMQVLAFAAPLLSRAWDIPRGSLGPVFGAGMFGYMIGATALSGLADRYGRKIVVAGGTLLFGVLTFISAAAASVEQLLALRLIAGIGLGASIPALVALNAEYVPARARGRRIATLYVGYSLGGMLGGFLAAQIMPVYGWQSVFVVGGLVPVLLAAALYFKLPESIRLLSMRKNRQQEVLALARRLAPHRTFTGAESFVVKEPSHPGLPIRSLFAEGRAALTLVVWATFITSMLGHHFLTAWLPSVLEDAGLPLADAVTAGAVLMAGGVVGGLLCGWLLDRLGVLSVAGLFVLSIPIVAAIGLVHDVPREVLMMLAFLTGFTVLGAQKGLNAIAATCYPTYIRSSGVGSALGVGRIGSIAGPMVGGLLIGIGTSVDKLFLYAALPAVCCAILIAALWMLMRRRQDNTAYEREG